MQCPVDGTTLQMSERGGVEIDYCPQCRGVWLDRGELDKIIAKSVEAEAASAPPPPAAPAAPPPPQQPQGGPWAQPGYPPQHGYDPRYGHKPYKRRKSFLEEIFD
ncbi:zf-TFIIB domain-containing protein [Sphingomonas sp. LHG3406-1]|uniref:TFIIB-type zinc ribbon-containing protein n=1 Tax=Sphingomonas sp. LHG3406-1 TaxID=2804617 RepID=UPI00261180E7|nr:zf-TFIIB domain-containing protein [Sphingomonas sp. LHG3406-1]